MILQMSFFKNILESFGLNKANKTLATEDPRDYINEEYLEQLEEELIRADLGVRLSSDFIKLVREKTKKQPTKTSDLKLLLEDFLIRAFPDKGELPLFKLKSLDQGLAVYLIVGVNGVGKTTSIAKLAARFKKAGEKVLLAAGDTFRAAAEEQLKIWSQRIGVDCLELEAGAKSSAVVYKALEKAQAEQYDVLIIDTAGRLHNKKNLMDELAKIKQVIEKNLKQGLLCETLLVVDASTGQNALNQARAFMEICDLSGLIVTKFDGSAKAGVIFAIAYELKLPVKILGVGEGLEDLEDFEPGKFLSKYF
jgi:fused signal recognition particle receptor